jgi:hypothetical protein
MMTMAPMQNCQARPAADAPASKSAAATCRETWARVTMDQFRHLAMQTF